MVTPENSAAGFLSPATGSVVGIPVVPDPELALVGAVPVPPQPTDTPTTRIRRAAAKPRAPDIDHVRIRDRGSRFICLLAKIMFTHHQLLFPKP